MKNVTSQLLDEEWVSTGNTTGNATGNTTGYTIGNNRKCNRKQRRKYNRKYNRKHNRKYNRNYNRIYNIKCNRKHSTYEKCQVLAISQRVGFKVKEWVSTSNYQSKSEFQQQRLHSVTASRIQSWSPCHYTGAPTSQRPQPQHHECFVYLSFMTDYKILLFTTNNYLKVKKQLKVRNLKLMVLDLATHTYPARLCCQQFARAIDLHIPGALDQHLNYNRPAPI